MPVLAAHIGSSEISFLYFSSPLNYKFFGMPYIYSSNIYGNYLDRNSFYDKVFQHAVKTHRLPSKDLEILVCSYPEDHCDISNSHCITLDKALNSINGYKYVYVDRHKVIESGVPIERSLLPDTSDDSREDIARSEEANFLANLTIYPFVKPINSAEQLDFDNATRSQLNGLVLDPEIPVVFTGDRFNAATERWDLAYLLMLDLISNAGFFELYLDAANRVAPLALLNSYNSALFDSIKDVNYKPLGTLLNVPGGVECLFETELGTSQLVDIGSNDLFLFPLEVGAQARVLIKSDVMGTLDRFVIGGELGFVIDTRLKQSYASFIENYSEKELRLFEHVISSRVGDL
ncbi:MAG: hypothetical protein ACOZAO_05715 [Patescibacteria group bacterium]